MDARRIGVGGNSLGGAKASWMLALDRRLALALVSGWAFDDLMCKYGKFCTRVPNQRLRELCDWPEFLALAAPRCAVLVLNGDADVIIDKDGDGTAWRGTRAHVDKAREFFAEQGGASEASEISQLFFHPIHMWRTRCATGTADSPEIGNGSVRTLGQDIPCGFSRARSLFASGRRR